MEAPMVRGDADGSLLVPGPKDQGHALLKQQVGSWSQPACQPGQGEAALAASFNLSAPARVSAGPPGPAAPPADASSEYAWIPLGRPNGTKKVDDADPISPGASVRRTHANEPAGAEIERGKDAVAALRPPALDTTAVSKGGQGSNVTSSRPLAEAWSEGDYALAEPAAYASTEPPAAANAQAQPARSNVLEMKPTDKSISQVAAFSLGEGNVTMATPTKSAIDHAMLAVQSFGQVKGGVVNTGSPLTSGALEDIISQGHVPGIVTPMATRAEGLMSGSKMHGAASSQGQEGVSQAMTVETKSECEHSSVAADVMPTPPPPPPPNAPPPEDVDSKMMLEEAASLLFDLKNSAGGYRKKELPEIGLTLPPDTIVTPVKWPDANSLTKPHVDTFFGVNVKKEKFERMLSLYKVLCGMHHQGIAIFETDGGCNVFGFSSVRVAKRHEWDEAMLRLAQYEVRKFRNGKAIKEPISCIYEVFKYCGMDVMQTGRHGAPLPYGEKKSLKQDAYIFNPKTFEKNKSRAAKGWHSLGMDGVTTGPFARGTHTSARETYISGTAINLDSAGIATGINLDTAGIERQCAE